MGTVIATSLADSRLTCSRAVSTADVSGYGQTIRNPPRHCLGRDATRIQAVPAEPAPRRHSAPPHSWRTRLRKKDELKVEAAIAFRPKAPARGDSDSRRCADCYGTPRRSARQSAPTPMSLTEVRPRLLDRSSIP